jgi:hypothetical protein
VTDKRWKVITRPMLIEEQRPEYCGAISEDINQCPVCPATVTGDDIVGGVCQARRSGPRPQPLVELVVVQRVPAP